MTLLTLLVFEWTQSFLHFYLKWWIGHVIRTEGDSLSKTAIYWIPEGRPAQVGQTQKYMAMHYRKRCGAWFTAGVPPKMAGERDLWRSFVAALCTGQWPRWATSDAISFTERIYVDIITCCLASVDALCIPWQSKNMMMMNNYYGQSNLLICQFVVVL